MVVHTLTFAVRRRVWNQRRGGKPGGFAGYERFPGNLKIRKPPKISIHVWGSVKLKSSRVRDASGYVILRFFPAQFRSLNSPQSSLAGTRVGSSVGKGKKGLFSDLYFKVFVSGIIEIIFMSGI